MNVTVYVPRELEAPLRKKARAARLSPALLIQSLVRDALQAPPAKFSDEFLAVLGSWEDERSADEIIADVAANRRNTRRPKLR